MQSKIHHAKVTEINLEYIGSIFIDEDLMIKSNIKKYEKVEVINLNTGHRWETYAMPEKSGSGIIQLNGGGARLAVVGDTLIILSYELTDKDVEPKMILLNEKNEFKHYL